MSDPLLQVQNLSVRYQLPQPIGDWLLRRQRYVDAVIDANFTLCEGQTLAIVGESGSGKSSLGRALIELEPVSGGKVLFRGADPMAANPHGTPAFYREVAMMFQDPISSLSPRRNVFQLISEPFRIHGVKTNGMRAEVERLLGLVGLPKEIADRYPHQLSGGQARRVGVARAIALDPKLIVADEPTAGLDVSVQADVLNLMRSLQNRFGMAYVLITHNISLIRHVADHIAVTYMGRIVEYGPTAAVLTAPAHPYAAGLIAAQPHPDPDKRRTEAPILGETPSLLHRPAGCEFRARCPMAFARCASEAPALTTIADSRQSRCHLSET